jgi:ESS family glutamate:Na+ symporter
MITFPEVVTLAIGAVSWLIGLALVKRIGILRKYNLPAPVIGGIVFAVTFALLKSRGIEPPKFDTGLVNSLMIGFFASLGFGASIRELKAGGAAVMIFLVVCASLLVTQVVVGMFVARLVGEPPLFGVLTSAVSLVGGPGTALSFAPEFEKAGVVSAASKGIAAAMLGILCGGIIGSPIATFLINSQQKKGGAVSGKQDPQKDSAQAEVVPKKVLTFENIGGQLTYHVAWVLIIGSVGWYFSQFLTWAGIKLPFYVGSMVVSFVVRNLDESFDIFHLDKEWVDVVGGTCLVLFISVSMMTLDLFSVADVAGPLLINLMVQALLVTVVAVLVIYRVMGRDYDAAVTSGGMIGFMLGTTANALATMKALTERFGPAPKAFLVVPLVGACFIDFVNAIVISITLNLAT